MVISNIDAVGKLKRKLGKNCSECGGKLELRTFREKFVWDGEEFDVPVDREVCSVCGESVDMEKETRHWKKRRGNLEV